MSFEISFTDALMLMPKFASTLKALIGNKEKLGEMAKTPINEHCSAIILNKLPKKLGDPSKFLIPCEFLGMDECLSLVNLGASINLMPLSVWKGLSLPELTPTCMTLELADRTKSKPVGIAKDVKVKVGVFHFPADFVVIDFEPDPRVPLILGMCFLKTGRALIDVHKGELTLRIGHEAITYNLDQTSRYSANYDQMTENKIDVTDEAYEEYSQEVLGFSDVTVSGSPTPFDDPIVSTTSPTLTPFGDSDFLLFEEADAFLGLENDPDLPELDPSYYDPEGDILLLEAILNSNPSPPLLNLEQSVPSFKQELKACEAKTIKSFIDELPEVELKDLPPHLEYAFLEGNNKLPGINVEFCTHKILMEEDYKPAVQHKRGVNPKIHDVIKKEVEKLLDAGLINPISDSPWVSPIHCVPKKGGFTVVANEENELIPTRLVTGWKRLHSHAPTGRSPIVACLLVYAMHRARFKGVCYLSFTTWLRRRWKYLWTTSRSLGTLLKIASLAWTKCSKGAKTPNYVLIGRRATLWSKRALSSAIKFLKIRLRSTKPKSTSFLNYLIPPLSKDTPFVFSEDCNKAFQMLKKKLTEAPILITPNRDLPFELMCDASNFAIGAVLGQHHKKHFWPIHYASKTLTDAESNYTTTEKEMLAVVMPRRDCSLETLGMVTFRGDSGGPCFADFANYHAGNFLVKDTHVNVELGFDVGRTEEHVVEHVRVDEVIHNSGEEAVEQVDEENEIVDPDVDVHLFGITKDVSFDNIYVTSLLPEEVLEGEDVDVVNVDGFDSDTSSENEKFGSSKEAKDKVYLHSIKSRRNLKLFKNDKIKASMSKAFIADAKTERDVRGDHSLQYSMLRDYVVELQSTTPNTTVKIAVERNNNLSLPTRVFKRIYVCLGL
nr:reverse transcriptase domain-containing protein [Tanacetum cinerariifolium]